MLASPVALNRVRKRHAPAEQVRSNIHQHVAHLDAGIRLHREDFAPHSNALLHHPGAFAVGQGALKLGVPLVFVRFPAERHTRAAIVVVGLEDKVRAAPTDVFEQLDRLGFTRGFYIAQQAGPGHVSLDQLALGWRKEFAIALVGQHREKGLLVRNLATQAVGDAHGARLVGADQRGAFGGPRNQVVDQHAAINEVNLAALRGQRSEEHTSELQSLAYLVCRLLLEKKKKNKSTYVARY